MKERYCAFPMTQGIDRILRMQEYVSSKEGDVEFSLRLPEKGVRACNIVILGEPGTGKSTLALELASRLRIVEADERDKRAKLDDKLSTSTVIYYSLEQSRKSLMERARPFEPASAIYLKGPEAGFKASDYLPDAVAGAIESEIRCVWKQSLDDADPKRAVWEQATKTAVSKLEDRLAMTTEVPEGDARLTVLELGKEEACASLRVVLDRLEKESDPSTDLKTRFRTACAAWTEPGEQSPACLSEFRDKLTALLLEMAKEAGPVILPKLSLRCADAGAIESEVREVWKQSLDDVDAARKAIWAQAAEAAAAEFERILAVAPEHRRNAVSSSLKQGLGQLGTGDRTLADLKAQIRTAYAAWKEPGEELSASCMSTFRAELKVLLKQMEKEANLVLMPKLSPRRLEQVEREQDEGSVFWDHVSEIRHLIDTFQEGKAEDVRLRMIVIDSLNVFADRPTTRYMIEQLFTLFRDKGIIGVFVSEDPQTAQQALGEPAISPGIANLADVVIKLTWDKQHDYSFRKIEVSKSRHSANVYGPQHMKMRKKGIEVYPSLHNWYTFLTAFEGKTNAGRDVSGKRMALGSGRLWASVLDRNKLRDMATHKRIRMPCLVSTITGSNYTKKTDLAMQYAVGAGRPCDDENKFLLVSMDVSPQPGERASGTGNAKMQVGETDLLNMSKSKGDLREIFISGVQGLQLWFAPGYLVAEEMVWLIGEVLRQKPEINRVLIHDIGRIPIRHPVLTKQIIETGTLFTVLIELFRNAGVDCCFSCTTDTPESRTMSKSLLNVSHFYFQTRRVDDPKRPIVATCYGRFVKEGYVPNLTPDLWSASV